MARSLQQKKTSILNPVHCHACGEMISETAQFCPHCGAPNAARKGADGSNVADLPYIKSRITGGVLALLLGGLGVHKFYCGDIGLGIVYLLFFWTAIPAIVGFIEGIIYLTCNSDEEFTRRFVH